MKDLEKKVYLVHERTYSRRQLAGFFRYNITYCRVYYQLLLFGK